MIFQPAPVKFQFAQIPTSVVNIHPPISRSLSRVASVSRHSTYWKRWRTLDSKHTPSFSFHASEIAKDEETGRRPSVTWEMDCWVVLQARLLCLAVGPRLYWDSWYSIFIVYLYDSHDHRQQITRSGILIVPTRNIWGHSEYVQEEMSVRGRWFGRAFWHVWRQIPMEAHRKVQLTFEYGDLPAHIAAEECPGHPLFSAKLGGRKDDLFS